MGEVEEGGYQPPPGFKIDTKEPVLDITASDSTEFWLIQWPKNRDSDFDGKEVTLKLHHNGCLGSFDSPSGKEYEVVSFAAPDPNATVFVSSASGTKVAGKISRRVSLAHYPEPEELQQLNSSNLEKMYQKSSAMSQPSSSHKTFTPQSSRMKNGRSTSKHSNRNKSSESLVGEPSETPKRIRGVGESSGSARSSGLGHSAVTSLESMGKSQKRKKTAE